MHSTMLLTYSDDVTKQQTYMYVFPLHRFPSVFDDEAEYMLQCTRACSVTSALNFKHRILYWPCKMLTTQTLSPHPLDFIPP